MLNLVSEEKKKASEIAVVVAAVAEILNVLNVEAQAIGKYF